MKQRWKKSKVIKFFQRQSELFWAFGSSGNREWVLLHQGRFHWWQQSLCSRVGQFENVLSRCRLVCIFFKQWCHRPPCNLRFYTALLKTTTNLCKARIRCCARFSSSVIVVWGLSSVKNYPVHADAPPHRPPPGLLLLVLRWFPLVLEVTFCAWSWPTPPSRWSGHRRWWRYINITTCSCERWSSLFPWRHI